MKQTLILFTVVSILCTSCATILNGKYQNVTINTPPPTSDAEMLLNGEHIVQNQKGKVKLKREGVAQQITIKKEGFKDEFRVVYPEKKSPWVILSIPFMYPTFGMSLLLDRGAKAYNYKKHIEIDFNEDEMIPNLSIKTDSIKEIILKSVSVNLDKDSVGYTFQKYKDYKLGKIGSEAFNGEDITMDNTVFSDMLNSILVKKGYIDTSGKTFKNSYTNNLLISSSIKNLVINKVRGRYGDSRMFYANLLINWKVLDTYGDSLFSIDIKTTSGEFSSVYQRLVGYDSIKSQDEIEHATKMIRDVNYSYYNSTNMKAQLASVKDALDVSFIKFMTNEGVQKFLDKNNIIAADTNVLDVISLNKEKLYASSLTEAVKASVTLKTKNGHGSGFFISSDGYLVTNYHVVSDTSGLEVYLNDAEEATKVEVVRISKKYDLALLKAEIENIVPIEVKKTVSIELGDEVFAIGTPTSEDLNQTISKGIISGKRKSEDKIDLVQTDASVNPGNSGGALVTKKGEIVGVVASKISGNRIEGISFSISADQIMEALNINFNK